MRDNIKNIQCKKKEHPLIKFKGQTKIELFENGEKVKEVKDNNMMTDMLSKIFNPPRMTIAGGKLSKSFNDLTPISTRATGGLLLYENFIDEDATLEYAPLTNRCIGHAGGTYSGTQSTRGTLNASESGVIKIDGQSDGYRYVWDFATDKANGTISCACLTSRAGGNCGYGKGIEKLYTEANGTFATELGRSFTSAVSSGQSLKINDTSGDWKEYSILYLGKGEDKRDRFACITDNNKLVLIEANLETLEINLTDVFDENGYKIMESNNKGKTGLSYFIQYYDLPFDISNVATSFFEENGKYCIVKHTSSTAFSFAYFDADTKSFSNVENRVVSPEYRYTARMTVCKSGDYWFALNGRKVIRYPDEGGTGEVIRTTSNSFGAIKSYKNIVYLISFSSNDREFMFIDSDNSDCYFHKIDNGDYVTLGSVVNTQLISEGILLAFGLTQDYQQKTIHIYAMRLSPYLATINNLQTPITKTSAQTMKITYEVTPTETAEVIE